MKGTKKIRIASFIMMAVMMLNVFALAFTTLTLPASAASTNTGLTFFGGYENLYSADKKLTVKPYTYEAKVKVPASYGDMWWGDILASYNDSTAAKPNAHYIIWDMYEPGTNKTGVRFLMGIRDASGAAIESKTVTFPDALNNYRGKDVYLALVIDSQNDTISLYVDGVKYTGTATNADAAAVTLYDKLDIAKFERFTLGGDFRVGIMNSDYKVQRIDNFRYFHGAIYNACAFNDARTATEVASDASAFPSSDNSFVFNYDTSAISVNGDIPDKSGNGYDLKKGDGRTPMTFTSGFESLYSAEKQIEALPSTYEAKIVVPSLVGDQYKGNILGWYDGKANSHYAFWDIQAASASNVDVRFLVGKRDSNGSIAEEVICRFAGALNGLNGSTANLALTLDSSTNTVTLYVNGDRWRGTPTYTSSGPGVASAAGLLTTYNSLDIAKLPDLTLGGDFRVKNMSSEFSVHHVDNWRYFQGGIYTVAAFSDVRTATEAYNDQHAMPTDTNLVLYYDAAADANKTKIEDKTGNGYDLYGNPVWLDTREAITGYAFSFAVVGDTQVIARDESVTSADTYSSSYNGNFAKIYDWLLENKDSKNIKFSFHMGDVTDWNNDSEWNLAMENITKLDGEIPYNIVRGNHDQGPTFIEKYTMDTFTSAVADGEEYGTFDGNTLNTYQTLTVGDVKYLMLTLDFGSGKAMINWANEVIASHPHHNVIISTHTYLSKNGEYMDDPIDCSATQYNPGGKYNGGDYDGNGGKVYWDYRLQQYKDGGEDYLYQDASYVWENLISKHENVVMVLCGHDASDYILNVEAVGDHGNKIAQVLVDPQGVDRRLQAAGQGHAGLVAMLYFSEDGKTVTTEYYSTIRDQYYKDAQNCNTYTLNVRTVTEMEIDTLEDKIAALDKAIEDLQKVDTDNAQALADAIGTLNNAINKLRDDMEDADESVYNELSEKIENADKLLADSIALLKEELLDALEKAVEDLEAVDKENAQALADAVVTLNNTIKETEGALKKADEDLNIALSAKIEEADKLLADAIELLREDLEQATDKLYETIAKDIAATADVMSEAILALDNLIKATSAALERVDAENKIEAEKALAAARIAFDGVIEKLKDDIDNALNELNAAIESGDVVLDAKIEVLSAAIKAAEAALKISDSENFVALATKISQANTALGDAVKKVQSNLEDTESKLEKAIQDNLIELQTADKKNKTAIIILSVVAGVAVVGNAALLTWILIDKKKKI